MKSSLLVACIVGCALTSPPISSVRAAKPDAKSEAAKLVGLPSYQTLTNWLDRYKVST